MYKKGVRTEVGADPDHLLELRKGVENWNEWRGANRSVRPNLSGVDFTDAAVFKDTPLWRDGPTGTVKNKRGFCDLSGADFSGCYLRAVNFTDVDAKGCDFRAAELIFADLTNADVWDVDITGADFGGANVRGADFGGVIYNRPAMRRNFLSVRGASDIVGDAVFKRDVQDQEFLDSRDFRIRRQLRNPGVAAKENLKAFFTLSPVAGFGFGLILTAIMSLTSPSISLGTAALVGAACAVLFGLGRGPFGRRLMFELWALFDFGRSWQRVAIFSFAAILLFGFVYSSIGSQHIAFSGEAPVVSSSIDLQAHPLHPWLFATAGFVSGGLLGLAGVRSDLALVLVILNGLVGISAFGLLISTLTATFSRRG
jgi:hypothetical protein